MISCRRAVVSGKANASKFFVAFFGRSSHPLADILIMSVLAVIGGADTLDTTRLFGKAHYGELSLCGFAIRLKPWHMDGTRIINPLFHTVELQIRPNPEKQIIVE